MKALNSIKFIVLLIGSMTPPAEALRAQTVSWTSSHPDIVSVDANGTIKMVSEPTATTDVTITQSTTQNGKTVTSIKTVQVDSCTACFTFQSPIDTQARTYCGVWHLGWCWMDRHIGASRAATAVNDSQSYGLYKQNTTGQVNNACPTGWRLPSIAEWLALASAATGRTLTASSTESEVSYIGLFESPLKIPSAGYNSGHLAGSGGYFWLRDANNTFCAWDATSSKIVRNDGSFYMSTRCIRSW